MAMDSGLYAVVLGVALMLTRRGWLIQVVAGGGLLIGLAVIYISQVRIALVIVIVVLGALVALLSRYRRLGAATVVTVFVGAAAVGAFVLALALAREAVVERLSTLIEDRPTTVYYENRGYFLEDALDQLAENPLGAGLGRWGMTNVYFGDSTPGDRGPLWVEIQWTGWIIDGGAPLVLMYVVLGFLVLRTTLRAGRSATGAGEGAELGLWSLVIAAYTIGLFALTFSYPIFISQGGMELWAFSAAIFSAAALRAPATDENDPPGRRRLRPDRRNGHGEPRARAIPGGAWRPGSSGEPSGR